MINPPPPELLRPEQSRARHPDESGFVERDGVRIAFEVQGLGEPTIVFLPSHPIVHSRQWKAQVPFLSRHHRVITYDGRGNGRSSRPVEPEAYEESVVLGDLVAVLDATGTDAAVLVGLCGDGVWRAIQLAASQPHRVIGIVGFAVGVPLLAPPHPWRGYRTFDEVLPTDDGWAMENRHFWQRDYPAFVRFFFGEMLPEPHSTKQVEDAVAWALDGSLEAMLADANVASSVDLASVETTCRAVRCPMLLVHGDNDRCQPLDRATRLSQLTGATLHVMAGAGHLIPGRHPVMANLLIRDFVRSLERPEP